MWGAIPASVFPPLTNTEEGQSLILAILITAVITCDYNLISLITDNVEHVFMCSFIICLFFPCLIPDWRGKVFSVMLAVSFLKILLIKNWRSSLSVPSLLRVLSGMGLKFCQTFPESNEIIMWVYFLGNIINCVDRFSSAKSYLEILHLCSWKIFILLPLVFRWR